MSETFSAFGPRWLKTDKWLEKLNVVCSGGAGDPTSECREMVSCFDTGSSVGDKASILGAKCVPGIAFLAGLGPSPGLCCS